MVDYAHKSVYSITRLRAQNGRTKPVPLGTAFLAGPKRLITCAHCIYNPKQPGDAFAQHQDGDVYMLINKDQHGNGQSSFISPIFNADLFVYQDIDVAIFHLPQDFYQAKKIYMKNPKNHLVFDEKAQIIGTDVGVVGYPLQEASFTPTGQIDFSSLTIRVDKGVINTRYNNLNGHAMYEFTMAFNPGNSGGPILNASTGTVVGIVHGFSSHAIQLSNGLIDWRSYSQAYAAENLKVIKSRHNLAFV